MKHTKNKIPRILQKLTQAVFEKDFKFLPSFCIASELVASNPVASVIILSSDLTIFWIWRLLRLINWTVAINSFVKVSCSFWSSSEKTRDCLDESSFDGDFDELGREREVSGLGGKISSIKLKELDLLSTIESEFEFSIKVATVLVISSSWTICVLVSTFLSSLSSFFKWSMVLFNIPILLSTHWILFSYSNSDLITVLSSIILLNLDTSLLY